MRIHKARDYLSIFDEKTGQYLRTGDHFMAPFPELLDIGIMGHCSHGRMGLCPVGCYQDGPHADNPNMSLSDFSCIARQCRDKTYQFALGGCGDPDQHENFPQILQLCRENGIVPNFTTSGYGMTEELAELCKAYCGAVAVSWYESSVTEKAIRLLLNVGVKTNIHFVLSKSTVGTALQRLKSEEFPEGINAIVFLLHKPVGLGTREQIITEDNKSFWELIDLVGSMNLPYKIGFDSCSVPALLNRMGNIDPDSLDTCEGGRWSAYITPDMQMLPCSFDNQERRWAVSLRDHTIKEAWDSPVFENFREHFRNSCPECENRKSCLGGCPIRPEIVLCPQKS